MSFVTVTVVAPVPPMICPWLDRAVPVLVAVSVSASPEIVDPAKLPMDEARMLRLAGVVDPCGACAAMTPPFSLITARLLLTISGV